MYFLAPCQRVSCSLELNVEGSLLIYDLQNLLMWYDLNLKQCKLETWWRGAVTKEYTVGHDSFHLCFRNTKWKRKSQHSSKEGCASTWEENKRKKNHFCARRINLHADLLPALAITQQYKGKCGCSANDTNKFLRRKQFWWRHPFCRPNPPCLYTFPLHSSQLLLC